MHLKFTINREDYGISVLIKRIGDAINHFHSNLLWVAREDSEEISLRFKQRPNQFFQTQGDMADDRSALAAKAFKASANYEEARPTYSVESVRFLLEKLRISEEKEKEMKNQPLTILELGCGTGKFTRVLMEVLKNTDARVIASDPLDTMLEEFRKILPNVEVKQITAEEIGRLKHL